MSNHDYGSDYVSWAYFWKYNGFQNLEIMLEFLFPWKKTLS